MPSVNLSVLNQRQTPALYADTFANIPAAGYLGRIFWSTDTFAIYRDNGTGWDLFGGPGTGTVTGTGTTGQIAIWNGSTIIGGTGTTGSGSVVLSNSPALSSPSFTSVNVIGGIAAMPTGSGTLLYSSALDYLVPYTGANANVDLGTNNLTANKIITTGGGILIPDGFAYRSGDIIGASLIARDIGVSSAIRIGSGNIGDYLVFNSGSNPVITVTTTGVINATSRLNVNGAVDNSAYGLNVIGRTKTTNNASNYIEIDSVSSSSYLALSTNAVKKWYLVNSQPNSFDFSITPDAGTTTGLFITQAGIISAKQRLNVNGATDNSLFALNVSGTINGSSPSFTGNTYTVTGNLSQQFYHVFTGAVGQTLTVPTPSGNNSQYLIVNNSANILTVAAFSGTNIVTLLGTSVGSITLAANARVLLIADGNNKYYQAF